MAIRFSFALVLVLVTCAASAQRIDSVHVFQRLEACVRTSASANADAWRAHRNGAEYRALKGPQMVEVEGVMEQYKPNTHVFSSFDDLAFIGMAFSGGRPVAIGVTADLDRVINFTARTEYRISTWAEHVRVRAMLAKLLLDQ